MKKSNKNSFYIAVISFTAFVLGTVLLRLVDVASIGPEGSSVGMATVNQFVHKIIGVNMPLYTITDWLSLVPIAFIFCFALLGLMQWVKRKSLRRVDFNLIVLGVFYIIVFAAYFLFETVVINYRPVLINGCLEASYPSSTTILVMCVMPTVLMQLNDRIKCKNLKILVSVLIICFMAFMVLGRLLSGVHWFSDIVGGAMLSISLVATYRTFCNQTYK